MSFHDQRGLYFESENQSQNIERKDKLNKSVYIPTVPTFKWGLERSNFANPAYGNIRKSPFYADKVFKGKPVDLKTEFLSDIDSIKL